MSPLILLLSLMVLSGPGEASKHPVRPEKPGICIRRFFIALACDHITRKCLGDYDCPGIQKCCRTSRCVWSCEPPAGPNPGRCPPPHSVPQVSFSHCEIDSDCGKVRKCCVNTQGRFRCVKPWRPRPAPIRGCPSNKGVITTCEFIKGIHCLKQSDCAKGKICCPYGCGKRCFYPVKG